MPELRPAPLPLDTQAKLLDAVASIQASPEKLCIVSDSSGRLVGTVTDGDVRRALLMGYSLDDPITVATNRAPVTATLDKSGEVVLNNARKVTFAVAVDSQGRPNGLYSTSNSNSAISNVAVIMAGGRGTRLLPLTSNKPKPLIEIAGRPMIEMIIAQLRSHGFRNLLVSINHLGAQIEEFLGDGSQFGVRISYLRESEALGTAGALSLIPEELNQPILVTNADLVTNCDFRSMVQFHESINAAATIGIKEYTHQIPFGVAKMSDESVLEIAEKPTVREFVSAGAYVFDPEVRKFVPRRQRFDMPELLNALIRSRKSKVVGFPIYESWEDVGRLDDLNRVRQQWNKN